MTKSTRWTFSFVGRAGFSALIEAHSELDALPLQDRFVDLTHWSLSAQDERTVLPLDFGLVANGPSTQR